MISLTFLRGRPLPGDTPLCRSDEGAWAPLADVYETAAGVVVEVEVPDTGRDALRIIVDGEALRVEGIKGAPAARPVGPAAVQRVHRVERLGGAFRRTLRLPVPVDAGQGRARLADGLLTIVLPRRRAAAGRS